MNANLHHHDKRPASGHDAAHDGLRPAASRRHGAPAGCLAALRMAAPTLTGLAIATASSVVLMLGGCANPGGIAPQAKPLAPMQAGVDADAALTPAIPADWWRAYNDPALDTLLTRALAEQPSLRVAQARLERARAGVAGARAAEGPQVNLALDATRERFSGNSIYPPPLGGSIRTLGTAQLEAGWELDFFGRHRAAIEAAAGAERAAQADLAAARNLLATNVVRAWVQIGRLQAQRTVAERALAQRQELLTLVQQRVQGGLDTNVELRQGEGALPETRLSIEQIDEQLVLARHQLAALTAQPPAAVDALFASRAAITQLPAALPLPSAVPADLLGRRADIVAARWRVEAASGDVANARTLFYPNINLTAFAGFSSIGLDHLLRAGSEQYGAGPALRLPIFDAGRLRANLRGRTADLDAAVESYNGAVLDAVHEVTDQLASIASLQRQQAEQQRAQGSAESAYDLATQRYRAGLGSYLVVLNAEASVLAQRRLAADLQARALDAQVLLVKALGGGQSAPELPAPAATATPHPSPRQNTEPTA